MRLYGMGYGMVVGVLLGFAWCGVLQRVTDGTAPSAYKPAFSATNPISLNVVAVFAPLAFDDFLWSSKLLLVPNEAAFTLVRSREIIGR